MQKPIDFADRLSRRRALCVTVAAAAFLGVQLVARPVFRTDGYGASGPRALAWAINAAVLLCLILPIGGFVWGRRVRELVNDEVSRANARTAAGVGFWVAMGIAFVVYAASFDWTLTAREAAYVVVTPTVGVVCFVFAWLERRAYQHG